MREDVKSCWGVLYTRPRAENKPAIELSALGAQVYCPTAEVLSHSGAFEKSGSKSLHHHLWCLSKTTLQMAFCFSVNASRAEWLVKGKNNSK